MTTCDVLAGICVALFAGVWADRLRRRPIMIAADIGRAAIIGSIPLAAWFGVLDIAHLYAAAFLAGILTTFSSLVSIPTPEALPSALDDRRSVRTEIAEGMRALWHDPRLRAIAGSRVAFSAVGKMFGVVILLFVRPPNISAGWRRCSWLRTSWALSPMSPARASC